MEKTCHAKSVAWTNRVISPGFDDVSNGFTVIWLFGQFRCASCNKLALSSDCKSECYHLLLCVAVAPAADITCDMPSVYLHAGVGVCM